MKDVTNLHKNYLKYCSDLHFVRQFPDFPHAYKSIHFTARLFCDVLKIKSL